MQNNSINAIENWILTTLDNSTLSQDEKKRLEKIGFRAMHDGLWRGNISDLWRHELPKLNAGIMPDLYT